MGNWYVSPSFHPATGIHYDAFFFFDRWKILYTTVVKTFKNKIVFVLHSPCNLAFWTPLVCTCDWDWDTLYVVERCHIVERESRVYV